MPYVADGAGVALDPAGLPAAVPRGFVPGIFFVGGVEVDAFGSASGVIVGGSVVVDGGCAVVSAGGGEAVAAVSVAVAFGPFFVASLFAPRMPR